MFTFQGAGNWYDRKRLGVSYVSLRVNYVNDNTPKFLSGEHHAVTLQENSTIDTVVVKIPAEDGDAVSIDI